MDATVLVVEDDAELRQMLQTALKLDYQVLIAGTAEEGLQLALNCRPDLALIDLFLPDSSGAKLCQALRSHPRTNRTRVIMISGHGEEEEIVNALNQGADDFLRKPFSFFELEARIRAGLRRLREAGSLPRRLGNLSLVPERMLAEIDGVKIPFSALEYSLLLFFAENQGLVVSREQILQAIWKRSDVTDRAVDAHIVSLRKKLGNFDHEILSVYGAGYSLQRRAKAGDAPAADAPTRLANLGQAPTNAEAGHSQER